MVLLLAGLVTSLPAWADTPTEPAPAPAPPASGVVIDRVAAVVNDEVVTLGEVYDFGGAYVAEEVARAGEGVRGQAEREVLERLVERRLVAQEMQKLKLELTDQDLERSIDDIARRNGMDRDGLRVEVERSGMGWDQYRAELRENLRDMKFAQAILRPRITITDDELRDAYLRATADSPTVSHVLAIFLAYPKGADEAAKAAVRETATRIRGEAVAGADFAALARAHDQGPFGAQNGEMGTFGKGELVGDLDAAVQNTAVGDVSAPVEVGQGVFLLKVVERSSRGGDFEAMREELADQVFATRLEDEKERWFQQARRQAAVKVLLPETKPAG
ncbi:MAG: peptidylprolyl isomerase [Myxococcota bacterium]